MKDDPIKKRWNKKSKPNSRRLINHVVNKGNPIWLVTFIDLISLLLAFFLMLYSMSSIKKVDWSSFVASLDKKQIIEEGKKFGAKREVTTLLPVVTSDGLGISYLKTILEAETITDPLLRLVEFKEEKDRLILSFPSSLIFRKGSAILLPKGKAVLFSLSEKLSNIKNRVALIGHSDTTPVSASGRYKNNWVLSLIRASAVADALAASGYRKPLNILSLGDTEIYQDHSSFNNQKKYELGRRVDIVIYSKREKG
ncbi:MAG: OmpA family protein [Flavobacteriaceae bacterium]|nr:OmpA family protein [Rhodospirillaceae bacterium]MBT7676615.1 OmpA family protein [Flavobacteriaceae bacterium]